LRDGLGRGVLDMTDPIKRKVKEALLPGKLSKEVAHGGERAAEQSIENIGMGEEVLFDLAFYEEAQKQARYWAQQAGVYTKMAVLIPTGIFALDAGLRFPDLDISYLGIGSHRFFLFHSGMAVWAIRKMYQACLVRSGDEPSRTDRVLHKILGVAAGSAAFGVGVHLLIDTVQPKSVVFPFFGSLVNGTLIDDNLWLLGNSLWCFKMSRDLFTIALGEDLPKVKAYVNKVFWDPMKEGLLDVISDRD
jgi:hypothetical protein